MTKLLNSLKKHITTPYFAYKCMILAQKCDNLESQIQAIQSENLRLNIQLANFEIMLKKNKVTISH